MSEIEASALTLIVGLVVNDLLWQIRNWLGEVKA